MFRPALLAVSLALTLTAPAAAAPGDLDRTFSGDGVDLLDFGSNDFASDVAAVPGGGVVVVGSTAAGDDVAVARYRANGTLDSSFDGDGKRTYNLGGIDRANSAVVQPDGKIVIGATADAGNLSQPAVLRLKPNGELDGDFSLDGRADITTAGLTGGNAYDVALQPDGKIVVGGDAYLAGGDDVMAARLTSTGAPDTTFAGDGVAIFDFNPGSSDEGAAVAAGPGNHVAVAGYSNDGSGDDIAVGKLDANGNPVTAFGSGGKRVYDIDGDDDRAEGVAFTPDGSLIVGGWFDFATSVAPNFADMVVLKARTNGTLDPAFGTGGRRTVNFTGGREEGGALEIGPGGSIVVAGSTDPTPTVLGDDSGDVAVARLTAGGAFDPTWSGDGRAFVDFGDQVYFTRGVAIEPGRGVAVAAWDITSDDFATGRLSIEPDNCPADANPDQTDTDGDGQGDLCDANDDNDPFSDAVEAALGTNPRSADSDGDGRGDGADACPTRAAATADGCPVIPGTPKPVDPAVDRIAPAFRFNGLRTRLKRRTFLRSGVAGRLTPNEPASFELQLLGRLRGARIARAGDVVIAEKRFSRSDARRGFRLKASRAVKRRLGKRMSLRLRVVATDAAGNRRTATRRIAIR